MSKHKKTPKQSKPKKHLNFEEAKNMTVEEAVRQDSHLKAGIKEGDSVLDRYIKQHREEIGAKKFETQSIKLDTQPLDAFIQKQRDLVAQEQLLEDDAPIDLVAPVATVSQDPIKQLEEEEMESILLSQSEPIPVANPKKRAWLLLGLLSLIFGIFAGGYWLSRQAKTPQTEQEQVSKPQTEQKDKVKQASAEAKKAFEDLFASFFVDDAKTQLKNERLGQLAELDLKLKALEGTSDYEPAKALVERLRKQAEALDKVNGQFTNPVLVDGSKVDGTIVDTANFDQLGTEVLNTGNPVLDNLIQSAISDGRSQQAAKAQEAVAAQQAQAQAEAQSAASQAVQSAPAVPAPDISTSQTWSQGTSQASVGTASPAATSYGITTYDPAILQRHLSRVPYNHDLVGDVTNPAWIFGEGVLERILETSRARGYIVGNDFILERVNIINGNGYYNMFKPDGTYLFSINAKTGYFVGNGRGYADALDY